MEKKSDDLIQINNNELQCNKLSSICQLYGVTINFSSQKGDKVHETLKVVNLE